MSDIVNRQLGSIVGEPTRVQRIYGVPSLLMVMVSDAGSVARLKGWSAVSIERNTDGRLSMTAVIERTYNRGTALQYSVQS